jgi:TonB family protein
VNVVSTPAVSSSTKRPVSAVARLVARCSGSAASILIHGGLTLLAFLSVAAPRHGRGGGTAGTPGAGSGPQGYCAIVQREPTVEAERSPDAHLFPQAEPEPPETPEAVVPPPQDFIKEQSETGTPVAKVPPVEDLTQTRPKRSYEKLPPAGGSEAADGPPKGGGPQKGDSTVSGTGGDTGGAGDGTAGALYMPSPEYPASARRRNIEGVVLVSVQVHPDGHCDDAQVVEGSGCDLLDDAAVSAIRKWRYEAHADAKAVLRRVRFVFKLTR